MRPTTYTLHFVYAGPRPHPASKAVETLPDITPPPERVFSYDGSGNNTGYLFRNSDRREHLWDEDDRLEEVRDNGGMRAKYLYAPDGERTQREAPAGTAFYLNQFYVLQPNELPTKHLYAGETRVASKTDPISYQKPFLAFYHPDHLGSTSYVSAADQDLLQHERYFPSGELWRDSEKEETDLGRPDSLRREWLFNAKEWEWDTGYYYYRARYYDPRQSRWLSPDPLLASYMRGEASGGVYAPRNLGLFTYTWNNPVVLQDPSGAAVTDNFFVRAAKQAAGSLYGSLQAVVPGGFLAPQPKGRLANDSDFLAGQAAGQASVGVLEMLGGGIIAGGGGAAEIASVGIATPVAVPVVVAGVAVAVHGAANVAASGNTFMMAKKAADRERAGAKSGETAATARGRQAHKDWDPGEGFVKEVRLPSGKQADAVNVKKGVVKALKPDNPRAVKRGEKQVEGYRQELQEMHPKKNWKGKVETYKR